MKTTQEQINALARLHDSLLASYEAHSGLICKLDPILEPEAESFRNRFLDSLQDLQDLKEEAEQLVNLPPYRDPLMDFLS